jgi:peptidoglycan/LPS O-acetylase OafA/YrhL
MRYRAEVDGLRAIAVLSVILFHAGIDAFQGGFVGVDVFFVISGYLITTILLDELESDRFSIARFYERRARRILPALFFVLLVSLPLAWLRLLPEDFRLFFASLAATAAFASNILFWRQSGYFETAAELNPLIHTWSLAIEEQFYLLFPLFLLFAWRLGRTNLRALLVVITLASLAAAHWAAYRSPNLAFFMLPTRAWELALGALVAFRLSDPRKFATKRSSAEAAGLVGIALILFSVVFYSESTPFPSLYALAPTVGAALLILFATGETLAGKLLQARVLVGIGLISYSTYLWHQPVLAFARHATWTEPGVAATSLLIAMSFALGYLSWRFVERPFRARDAFSMRQIFVLTALACVAFGLVGLVGQLSHVKGYQELKNPMLSKKAPVLEQIPFTDCSAMFPGLGTHCRVTGDGEKTIFMWGDSHAGFMASASPAIKGYKLYILSHPGCPPLMGVRRFGGPASVCNRVSTLDGYAHTIKTLKPDVLVLTGRWSLYANGLHKQGVPQKRHFFVNESDDDSTVASQAKRTEVLGRRLRETIEFFSDVETLLVMKQVPDYAQFDFRQIQSSSNFVAPAREIEAWLSSESEMFASLGANEKLQIVDSKVVFCRDGACRTRDDDSNLLYTDDNHLSPIGAIVLWRHLLRDAATLTEDGVTFPGPRVKF